MLEEKTPIQLFLLISKDQLNGSVYYYSGRSCQDVKFTSITSHPETKVSLTLVNQYPTDITMYWLDFQV